MAITYYCGTQVLGCPICGKQPNIKYIGVYDSYVALCKRPFHKKHFEVFIDSDEYRVAVERWNKAVLQYCNDYMKLGDKVGKSGAQKVREKG